MDLQAGDPPKHHFRRPFPAESLLMAVRVNEGLSRFHRAEIERGSARLRLPQQEFVEQERSVREARALLAGEDEGELIPEGQEAGRLQPHNGHPTLNPGREGAQETSALAAGLFDQARVQESTATASGSPRQGRKANLVSRRLEDSVCGAGVLGLEVSVESIDPEEDLRPVGVRPDLGGCSAEHVPPPLRAFAAGGEAEHPLSGACQQPVGFAEVGQHGEASGPRCESGQPRDETLTEGESMAAVVVVQKLDLHAGHVDAGGALLCARFTPHAERECVVHLGGREGVRAELAGEGEAQCVGPSACRVALVSRGPERGAHEAGVPFSTGSVVVAHLGGARPASQVGPVQHGGHGQGTVPLVVAHQGSIVHAGGVHDLPRVERAGRIERPLDLAEGRYDSAPQHGLQELGTNQAVTVFARVCSSEATDELMGLLRDGAHGLQVLVLLEIQDGPHVQTSDRGMGIPRARSAVTAEHVLEERSVLGKMLERHGAVLDEGDGFSVALHRHDDVHGRLPHGPDPSLKVLRFRTNECAGVAEVPHQFLEPVQVVGNAVPVRSRELDNE